MVLSGLHEVEAFFAYGMAGYYEFLPFLSCDPALRDESQMPI